MERMFFASLLMYNYVTTTATTAEIIMSGESEEREASRDQLRRISVIEQHIGTIVNVVIAGTLVWIGSTVVDMRSQMAVLQTEVRLLSARASTLDDALMKRSDNSWDRKDQDQFSAQLRERLNGIDARLTGHSNALDDIRRRLERMGVPQR